MGTNMSMSRMGIIVGGMGLLLTGCVAVEFSHHPPDVTVTAAKNHSLCAPQILFMGPGGDITVEKVMREGGIVKVRKIEQGRYFFLLAGGLCTVVTGEGPEGPAVADPHKGQPTGREGDRDRMEGRFKE